MDTSEEPTFHDDAKKCFRLIRRDLDTIEGAFRVDSQYREGYLQKESVDDIKSRLDCLMLIQKDMW